MWGWKVLLRLVAALTSTLQMPVATPCPAVKTKHGSRRCEMSLQQITPVEKQQYLILTAVFPEGQDSHYPLPFTKKAAQAKTL